MRAWYARVLICLGLALAVVCGFQDGISAQEPPPEEEVLSLEPVQVKGQMIENIHDVKKELARRPGSNILIEEKDIKETRALNLEDVLRFAPGVRFQSRFGADEGQFQIRGTSLRNNFHHRGINILINGIFFGDADGFSDFESIDLLACSDHAATSLSEAMNLLELKIFDNLTLLKMWCETTPATIFPERKIGRLQEGYEASFLVLKKNPLENFEHVATITMRVKQGHRL